MRLYFIELISFALFVVLIFVLKVNKNKDPKKLTISIATGFGIVLAHFIIDMILGIVMVIFNDDKTISLLFSVFLGITQVPAMFLGAYIISLITGSKKSCKIILAFTPLVLILCGGLAYASALTMWNINYDFENMSLMSVLEETEEMKTANTLSAIRLVVGSIPSIAYMVSVLIGKTSENKA